MHSSTSSPFDFLAALARQPRLRVVGLMSGTSGDGLDVALVDLRPSDDAPWGAELVAFESVPYDDPLRFALSRAIEWSVADLCSFDFRLGELAASAISDLIESQGLRPQEIDLIGSHGHTVWHQPPGESGRASTLQIGQADVIAARTGVTTVSDFRTRDVAVGGQGAPLVPMAEWLLRRPTTGTHLFLNLGGMANLSVIPTESAHVVAFDTGPGVALIDAAARWASRGDEAFDRDGERAARGKVDVDLLAELQRDPYFERRPPKSTGRERFGTDRVRTLLSTWRGEEDDLLATLTRLTAWSVADAIHHLVTVDPSVGALRVSGGGAHNPTLLRAIHEELPELDVVKIDDPVLTIDAKEAVAFAVLAAQAVRGGPGNLPSVTGARSPVVLGKFSLGFSTERS